MTVIVELTGETIIENVFPLLDITRLDLPPSLRPTKKYKIPYCGIPGAILSAKFSGVTRGIVKSKTKQSFLNSITIDICTSKKNINAKLSGKMIQMCGPDSEKLARETADHIITHLKTLQQDLDYINQDIELKDRSIEWLKQNTEGDNYIIDIETQEIIELIDGETVVDKVIIKSDGTLRTKQVPTIFSSWNEGDFITDDNIVCNSNKEPYQVITGKDLLETAVLGVNFFLKTRIDDKGKQSYYFTDKNENPIQVMINDPIKIFNVKSIKIPNEYPNLYPEDIDERIVNFYLKHAPEYAYHHVFCQFLDSVRNIDTIATDDIGVSSVNMAMINYSYSLGMSVDRWALANYINGLNGFTARYCNSTDHSVTISLPYEIPEGSKRVRRKNKTTRHTFMVHKSGIVTQSGPNIDLMRDAYYKFIETLEMIRPLIIQEDRPFNLKYRPIKYIAPKASCISMSQSIPQSHKITVN